MSEIVVPREHEYHAEASVLDGELSLPLVQKIHPQAYANLPGKGGYLSQRAERFRVEGAISFESAHTQVSGNPGKKTGHGWSTLATSVVEGLNVLDVLTADRVVAQISVDHPTVGYVPTVTFLGTRFENLRIGGHPVDVDLDLNMLGPKPDGDEPYTKGKGFLDRVNRQHEQVRTHSNLLEELLGRYTGVSSSVENPEAVECSLANQAKGSFPGQCHGHVIHVPDFGTICLANLRLEQSEYDKGTRIPKRTLVHLTMIDIRMGCLANGTARVGVSKTNGTTKP